MKRQTVVRASLLGRGDFTGINNHAADGKDLLLFDMLGGGRVRFRGPFNCTGYSFEDGTDSSGNTRKAIVFHLAASSRRRRGSRNSPTASKSGSGGSSASSQ